MTSKKQVILYQKWLKRRKKSDGKKQNWSAQYAEKNNTSGFLESFIVFLQRKIIPILLCNVRCGWLLCKVKQQLLLTCKVSSNCCLTLQGRFAAIISQMTPTNTYTTLAQQWTKNGSMSRPRVWFRFLSRSHYSHITWRARIQISFVYYRQILYIWEPYLARFAFYSSQISRPCCSLWWGPGWLPREHETSTKCWNNVGTSSTTLAQHRFNIRSMSRVDWLCLL